MACFHPLKGFQIGYHSSGKPEYKITGYDVNFVKKVGDRWIPCYEKLISDFGSCCVSDYIDIPCGHCIGCYLDRSKQWADRCMLEASYHEKNCFITLTYDDEHITKLRNSDYIDDDGVINKSPFYSLDKSDLQKFMKRLRARLSPLKIRYFACGEYGSQNYRPHFHAIIFGYDFSDDRTLYKTNFRGDRLFTSGLLSDCWTFGYAVVADCTWNTCAYVSRYCLKKRDNDLSVFYNTFDLDPEFVCMSRRPGIARQYFDDHFSDIYRYDRITIGDQDGSRTFKPPKYFDKCYDIDYPSDMARIKEHRLAYAKANKEYILQETDLDYLDYLKVKEYNLSNKTKIFKERRVAL